MRSAARPGARDARTSSPGLVACFIEGENKGLSRSESFFLRTIFQHSTKSFPFGVLGWLRRREWAIKLMNGRLMDFIPLLRGKTKDAHKIFFFLIFQEFEKLTFDRWRHVCTFQYKSDHSSSFSNSNSRNSIIFLTS